MDLPTYTNIWRIEKRLYKLYDFRLPMPLPISWIAVFCGITVPYVVVLAAIGVPFDHNLFFLYVLPPGVLTWLSTRPVLENKRLPELLGSQLRYVGEPRTWARMVPLAEKNEIHVYAKVWHRFPEVAEEPALAAASAAQQSRGRRRGSPVQRNGPGPGTFPARLARPLRPWPARPGPRALPAPRPSRATPARRAGPARACGRRPVRPPPGRPRRAPRPAPGRAPAPPSPFGPGPARTGHAGWPPGPIPSASPAGASRFSVLPGTTRPAVLRAPAGRSPARSCAVPPLRTASPVPTAETSPASSASSAPAVPSGPAAVEPPRRPAAPAPGRPGRQPGWAGQTGAAVAPAAPTAASWPGVVSPAARPARCRSRHPPSRCRTTPTRPRVPPPSRCGVVPPCPAGPRPRLAPPPPWAQPPSPPARPPPPPRPAPPAPCPRRTPCRPGRRRPPRSHPRSPTRPSPPPPPHPLRRPCPPSRPLRPPPRPLTGAAGPTCRPAHARSVGNSGPARASSAGVLVAPAPAQPAPAIPPEPSRTPEPPTAITSTRPDLPAPDLAANPEGEPGALRPGRAAHADRASRAPRPGRAARSASPARDRRAPRGSRRA